MKSYVTRVIDRWDGTTLIFYRTNGERVYCPTLTSLNRFKSVIVPMCEKGLSQAFGSHDGPHFRFDIKKNL
jgi:hypothetical protein